MVITNQALNTSSSRRLGKALQTYSNHGQDREKGLIQHHRLRDGEKKKKKTQCTVWSSFAWGLIPSASEVIIYPTSQCLFHLLGESIFSQLATEH